MDLLEAKGRIEVEWSRRNVADGCELDVIDHVCEGNERVVETNPRRRVRGPGGPEGDQKATGAVKRDWRHESEPYPYP